jgi:hypothetical protein
LAAITPTTTTDGDPEYQPAYSSTEFKMNYHEDKFKEWFNEIECFGLRSERFYESLEQFQSTDARFSSMVLWLQAAYHQGFRDAIKQLKG